MATQLQGFAASGTAGGAFAATAVRVRVTDDVVATLTRRKRNWSRRVVLMRANMGRMI